MPDELIGELIRFVVAHEVGHGLNDKIYQQAGSGNGMISGALHEGMADVTGAFLFDDPKVGDDSE